MNLQLPLDLRSKSVGSKKGYVNRMTTQIEVRANKKFDDVNQNNVNRGDVNRRITVHGYGMGYMQTE